jgi:hypothetical protein
MRRSEERNDEEAGRPTVQQRLWRGGGLADAAAAADHRCWQALRLRRAGRLTPPARASHHRHCRRRRWAGRRTPSAIFADRAGRARGPCSRHDAPRSPVAGPAAGRPSRHAAPAPPPRRTSRTGPLPAGGTSAAERAGALQGEQSWQRGRWREGCWGVLGVGPPSDYAAAMAVAAVTQR